MTISKKHLAAAVSLLVLLIVGATMDAPRGTAQGSTPVTVTNAPLPVDGTVHVVQDSHVPFLVALTHNPTVALSPGTAVGLAPGSVPDPDHHQFRLIVSKDLATGSHSALDFFFAPPDKAIVIDFASVVCDVPAGSHCSVLLLAPADVPFGSVNFGTSRDPSFSFTQSPDDVYWGNQSLHVLIKPGEPYQVSYLRDTNTAPASSPNWRVVLQGHYADCLAQPCNVIP